MSTTPNNNTHYHGDLFMSACNDALQLRGSLDEIAREYECSLAIKAGIVNFAVIQKSIPPLAVRQAFDAFYTALTDWKMATDCQDNKN